MGRKRRKVNLKYDGHESRTRQLYFKNVSGHSTLDKELAWKLLKENQRFKRLIGSNQWIELSDITTLINLQYKQGKTGSETVRYLQEYGWL